MKGIANRQDLKKKSLIIKRIRNSSIYH